MSQTSPPRRPLSENCPASRTALLKPAAVESSWNWMRPYANNFQCLSYRCRSNECSWARRCLFFYTQTKEIALFEENKFLFRRSLACWQKNSNFGEFCRSQRKRNCEQNQDGTDFFQLHAGWAKIEESDDVKVSVSRPVRERARRRMRRSRSTRMHPIKKSE